jgi:aryl-alcohol dehydrogenase-like predicted oxidoreductase
MIETRLLGRSDIRVSALCLGTMTWGQQNTEAEGHAQLDYALDHGINFIDTAEMYSIPPRAETQGSTERIIGSWLNARRNRNKIVLATKVAGPSAATYLRADGTLPRLDRQNIRAALQASLARLRTDYVDLYQVHWPDRPLALFGGVAPGGAAAADRKEVPIEETLAALGELVTEGTVRQIGVSNETAWGLSRYLHISQTNHLPRVVSVQNAYNLLNRTYEVGLAEFASREQVGLLAYSPLGQGYLTGKYRGGARPPGARTTLFNRGGRYEKPGAAEAIDKYLAIADDFGLDPAQMAIAYVTSRPFVTSNIIGATTMAQLQANIGSQEVTITPEIEARIDEVYQLHGSPAP